MPFRQRFRLDPLFMNQALLSNIVKKQPFHKLLSECNLLGARFARHASLHSTPATRCDRTICMTSGDAVVMRTFVSTERLTRTPLAYAAGYCLSQTGRELTRRYR